MIKITNSDTKPNIPQFGLVIPCANVAQHFPFYRIKELLQKNPDLVVALVNDGSTDRTAAVLRGIQLEAPEQVFLLHLPESNGKAEAIRQGMLALHGQMKLAKLGYVENLSQPQAWLTMAKYQSSQPQLGVVMGSPLRETMGLSAFPGWKKIKYLFQRQKLRQIFQKPLLGNHWPANVFHHCLVPFLFQEPFGNKNQFEREWMQRLQHKFGAQALVGGAKEFALSA